MGLTTRKTLEDDMEDLPVFDIDVDIMSEDYPEALKRAIEAVLNQQEAITAFQSFAR